MIKKARKNAVDNSGNKKSSEGKTGFSGKNPICEKNMKKVGKKKDARKPNSKPKTKKKKKYRKAKADGRWLRAPMPPNWTNNYWRPPHTMPVCGKAVSEINMDLNLGFELEGVERRIVEMEFGVSFENGRIKYHGASFPREEICEKLRVTMEEIKSAVEKLKV